MVHYPFAQHIFSSNKNLIYGNTESEISNDVEEMSNDLLTNDLKSHRSSEQNQESVKNKYSLKFKRNAKANPMMIEACCTKPQNRGQNRTQDPCKIHHCH